MTKTSQTIQNACRVLRNRVRFKNFSPGFGQEGEKKKIQIQDDTRIYVETWIVPIIDMIERGDTKGLASFCRCVDGDKIDPEQQ